MPNGLSLSKSSSPIEGGFTLAQIPGLPAFGTLRIAANVAAGQTITVGASVFRVAALTTDSGATVTRGELNNTDSTCELFNFPAHGLKGGDLIRVQNEIALVTLVLNANQIKLLRGVSGTTIAAHADGQSIFTEAAPGAGNIAVGLNTTLTPAAFTPAFVADFNNVRRCQENVQAIQISTGEVLFVLANREANRNLITPIAGVSALATTETLAGAGNGFDAATLGGGQNPGVQMTVFRVPTAAEVTAGSFHIMLPFAPTVDRVKVITTSTQATKAWDGAATVVGNRVTIGNGGSVDWAVTDTVEVTVHG